MTALPYSLPVPLRTSAAWGRYRTLEALPRIYGRGVRAPLIQYSEDRRRWVWCDHPATVRRVLIDGVRSDAWDSEDAPDSTGAIVCFVELSEPLPEGSLVWAEGDGLVGSTGALVENPADVLTDVLALAGSDPDLSEFRVQCSRADIALSGRIADTSRTLRSIVDEICQSAGAVWERQSPGFARLYPGTPDADEPPALIAEALDTIEASTALADVYTAVRVQYAYDYGEEVFRGVVEVQAPEPVRRYGRRVLELSAPWLASGRLAQALAERHCRHRARPVWQYEIQGADAWDVPLLRFAEIPSDAQPTIPSTAELFLLAATRDFGTRSVVLSGQAPYGPEPAVEVTLVGTAYEAQEYASAAVTGEGGAQVITLTDESGSPLASASVTVAGGPTKTADGAGRVRFEPGELPPGSYTLTATAPGRQPLQFAITI